MLIKWKRIARFIKKIYASTRHSLLLKNLEIDDNDCAKVVLQVIGKPIFFDQSVKELMRNEKLLFQLPPDQIKMIVKLACSEDNIPAYQIYAIDQGSDTLLVKEVITGNIFDLHIKEIKGQSQLIDNFSKKEIFMIGIFYNEYICRIEREALDNIKTSHLRLVK